VRSSVKDKQWAVLGGGMLGLTIALRIAQSGRKVTLIEASPSFGGVTSTCTHDGVSWDRYYHVVSASDRHLLALLDELGLSDELVWGTTKTNFFDGSVLSPLNNVFDYLRLPALGAIDKLRLGINILYGSRCEDGIALEHEKVEDWLVRWSGRNTFEKLWRPLLRSKLGDNFQHASAAYIWATIRRFYGARQGAKKTELFGYVRGGYARVIEAIIGSLAAQGVSFEAGYPVNSVAKTEEGLAISSPTTTRLFDEAVVTFASPLVARMCRDLDPSEKQQHEAILYQGVVCSSMLLTRPLGDAYLTYITDETIPFTTIIEMSSLIDRVLLRGHHLVYLPKYVPSTDPLLEASDSEIANLFIPGLQRIFPDFRSSDIVSMYTARARYVTAFSTLDYSARLPPIKTTVPGLHVCNSAQIVNASLSVNETVDLANRVVAEACFNA
jgi:protoporphyrinogen oxidase